MAAGIKRLQRIQLGKETVPGTAVAATTRWRGAGNMLDDQRKVEEIEELIGVMEGADRTAVVGLLGAVQMAETPATPEQAQYLLAMGLGGSTTGAADGPGSGRIYTTNLPTTARPAAVPYTVEGGDDFEVQRMEYCVCTKIALSGAMGQTARMGGTVMGRQVQRLGAGFSAATIPAVSELPVQSGKFYLDPVSGAYGATQISNTIVGFKVDLDLKWALQPTMDGNLFFSYASLTGYSCTGEITFLHDTAAGGASGALADFRNQTPKLMRIDLTGDALASGGTAYQAKKLIVDLPIKYRPPGPLGEVNGNDMYVFKFRSRYNITAGNAGKFIVVSELATLP